MGEKRRGREGTEGRGGGGGGGAGGGAGRSCTLLFIKKEKEFKKKGEAKLEAKHMEIEGTVTDDPITRGSPRTWRLCVRGGPKIVSGPIEESRGEKTWCQKAPSLNSRQRTRGKETMCVRACMTERACVRA